MQGTPVKSCMTTRAGVNWISVSGSAFGSHAPSAVICSAVTFAPYARRASAEPPAPRWANDAPASSRRTMRAVAITTAANRGTPMATRAAPSGPTTSER